MLEGLNISSPDGVEAGETGINGLKQRTLMLIRVLLNTCTHTYCFLQGVQFGGIISLIPRLLVVKTPT